MQVTNVCKKLLQSTPCILLPTIFLGPVVYFYSNFVYRYLMMLTIKPSCVPNALFHKLILLWSYIFSTQDTTQNCQKLELRYFLKLPFTPLTNHILLIACILQFSKVNFSYRKHWGTLDVWTAYCSPSFLSPSWEIYEII